MIGWQYWAYCGCDDPTTTGPGTKQALVVDPSRPPRGKNVDRTKLRLLALPHPLRVAGTPTSYDFDRDKHVFELRYDPTKVEGGRFGAGSRTTVAVPKLQFPGGYAVRVKGARVVSKPGARTLVLALEPGSDHVVVRVMPRSVALAVTGARPHQPRLPASAPIVVSSPWPVCTTVSSGSANSRARIDSTIRSAVAERAPGRARAALEQGVAGEHAAEVGERRADRARRVARRVEHRQRRARRPATPGRRRGRRPTGRSRVGELPQRPVVGVQQDRRAGRLAQRRRDAARGRRGRGCRRSP